MTKGRQLFTIWFNPWYVLDKVIEDDHMLGNEPSTRGPGSGRSYLAWIEKIKRRDHDTWSGLVDLYAEDLRRDIQRSLVKYGLSVGLIEDISQETWLSAFRCIDTFVWQDEKRFYHWLRVISCNHIHRAYRATRSESSIDDFSQEDAELESFFETYRLQGRSVEDEVVIREQMEALLEAFDTLKTEESEILVRWLMGETPRALASEYQKKPRSISILVLRAKQKIEAALPMIQSRRGKKGKSDYEPE